jgi:hypothetical protein
MCARSAKRSAPAGNQTNIITAGMPVVVSWDARRVMALGVFPSKHVRSKPNYQVSGSGNPET